MCFGCWRTLQADRGKPLSRYNIPIPQPNLTPLSTLLATLSQQTSLPLDQLKLIYKGAVLKDPSLTIASYGITDGSALVLVGKEGSVPAATSSTPPPKPPTANAQGPIRGKVKQPETDSEGVLTDWIKNLVRNTLEPLQASIATFVSYTSPKATNRPAQIPAFEVLQREHARLSEILLRGLLDLDNVEIRSGWTEARKERKEGVKRIQNELTKVDEAWGERKKLGG